MALQSSTDNHDTGNIQPDISLAAAVQQLLFPRSSPVCSWCCIGVKNRMANKLGGDYFDFIEMPDGCQTLYIGDVTGHGLHASVIMSLLYGFIHRASLEDCNPLKVVRGINRFLRSFAQRSEKLDHLFSTTLFFATVDPKSFRMDYINCGHIAPLVRRGDQLIRLDTTGPPLGFFETPEVELGKISFCKGDRLLLYTDGVSEAFNEAGEQYGRNRVEADLMELGGTHLEYLETMYARTAEFTGAAPLTDDSSAIVLDFHTPLPGALA